MASQPQSKTPPPRPGGGARTQVAVGGVVPPQSGPARPHAATVAADATDFQLRRATRVGTQMAGMAGLEAPSSEGPKLKLNPGSMVPGTRYKIVRWLGEGGMGVVYEAEHVDIERRVAFKILRFDLSKQPRMVQVFRDEARAASRMGSANIVDIYDFGELPDGRLYFCMELLEGKDLVPESETDTMEPGQLVGMLRQACKGLHAAHRAGVVHRDIKPENIITITKDGRAGVVKIVDFGISSMLAAGQTGGGIAGTPHYMAPEQITGQAFDGRLDIYALGITAYELLVGQPPFDADELEPLLQMHLAQPPPPPSALRPDLKIPPPLEGVIMRCIEKNPDGRYTDMADLEAALCEAQIEAGLHTPFDDLPLPEIDDLDRKERLLKQMPSPLAEFGPHKRRWVWPVVAGLSTLAAASLAAVVLLRGPTDEQKSQVELIINDARDAATKANWVFPPPQQRDAPTAFTKILELESMEGPAARYAEDQASELRKSFAQTLIEHGNELWQIPEARPMARDYYAWGVLFDDENPEAFERSGMSSGALADLADRLKNGQFTAAELALSRMAAVAVETDETRKAEFQDQLASVELDALGISGGSVLDRAARATGVKMKESAKEAPEPEPAPDPEENMAADLEDVLLEESGGSGGTDESTFSDAEAATVEEEKKKKARRRAEAMLGSAKRNPKKAAELANEGMAALNAGRRGEAESLFNQAIAFDNKNPKALMGLSDVYFDRNENNKAVLYAEKAVKAAPGNGRYRIKLGDAYFKVLRYRDALTQYESAKKSGEKRADDRIAKVKGKLGG